MMSALLIAACSPAVAPDKIVSDNPCVDAILADVASPSQIGAVSMYSQNLRSTSVPLDWARRFPSIGGTAEEIISARPALYITGAPMSPITQAAAAHRGIKVLAIKVPNSVAESLAQIREVAHAIGRPAQGEALAAEIEVATKPLPSLHRAALIYQGGGLILGAHTLADDLLFRTGFNNAARTYGSKPWDVQPLESVIMAPPDIILSPHTATGAEERGLSQLRAALRRRVAVVDFDPKLLYCGARSIIKARARLMEIRRNIDHPHSAWGDQ